MSSQETYIDLWEDLKRNIRWFYDFFKIDNILPQFKNIENTLMRNRTDFFFLIFSYYQKSSLGFCFCALVN